MTTDPAAVLAGFRLLPVPTVREPATAAPPADALSAGGARCAEVAFRTPDAELRRRPDPRPARRC